MELAGLFLASLNARALRILVPSVHCRDFLREAALAKEVIVSRGFWPAAGNEGFEILFDDHSETPYALHLEGQSCLPMISRSEHGQSLKVTLWTLIAGRPSLSMEFQGRFRVTPKIPWGRSW